VTAASRRDHGTTGTIVFVVGLRGAGAILLWLSIPMLWAVLATLALLVAAVRMVHDIRGGRAM
jgi:hypothetical protein